MKVVEGEKWRSMKMNINKIKSAFSVFGVLISVFLITDLHAMWENDRHLYTQGMLDSFSEDQKLYSPILGMVLLESDIAQRICRLAFECGDGNVIKYFNELNNKGLK